MEWNITYADGTRYVYLNPGFASMSAKMQVVFRQRPASATSSVLSVKGLEDIKFAPLKVCLKIKYHISELC